MRFHGFKVGDQVMHDCKVDPDERGRTGTILRTDETFIRVQPHEPTHWPGGYWLLTPDEIVLMGGPW